MTGLAAEDIKLHFYAFLLNWPESSLHSRTTKESKLFKVAPS